jgi:hypothetical protein
MSRENAKKPQWLYAVRSRERGTVYAIFSSDHLARTWIKAAFDPDDPMDMSTYRLDDPTLLRTIERWSEENA